MSLPVLIYHGLEKYKTNNRYVLCENDFELHLRYLTEQGISCPTVGELIDGEQWPAGQARVGITFDDGHLSDVEIALPLLQKYGCGGTFFITSDWIGRPGYMQAAQIKELQAAGMSVQSHAKSHAFLDTLSREEVERELALSKRVLENILGQAVDFLSCPGGRYTREVVARARQVGYRAIFTSAPYLTKMKGEVLVVGRRGVRYRAGGIAFRRIVQPSKFDVFISQAAYSGKFILKRSLGNRIYQRIWERLIKEGGS